MGSSTQNLVGDPAPSISYNLSVVSDWSTAMPFLDLMKMSRPWFGQDNDTDGWGDVSNEALAAGGHLDENGWVTSLPRGVDYVETIFDWGGAPDATASRAGRYVLSYEGEGAIDVWGAEIVSREPGRIVIDNPAGTTFSVQIHDPDLSDNGNYVRNMTLVAEDKMPLFEAGATFNPQWIDIIGDSADLRFMDWGRTNNSELASWADRPQVADATYAGEFGVPIEVMIELCNQTGSDLWINIPHLADDDYVRNAAELIRDNLDPRLSVHVEYSNEAWNWAFDQADHMLEMAQQTFGNDNFYDYQSYRATQVAMIFDAVFEAAPEPAPELLNVYGVQTGWFWTGMMGLQATSWQDRIASGEMKAPGEVFDQIGVTTYFGGAIVTDEATRGQLLDMIENGVPQQEINAWLYEKIIDPEFPDSVPANLEALQEWKALADSYGMELVAYEGGQHVHHSFAVDGLTDAEAEAMSDALAAFVRSPEMADLYIRNAEAWAQVSDEPYMQYGDVGTPSRWGSWDVLSSLDDDNPRYQALTGPIAEMIGGVSSPAHQRGIYHFGTAADEVIRGTAEEDFISAGVGDDVIHLGGGNDGVHGGNGIDTVIVNGRIADYSLRFEGDVAILEGNGATVRMVEVERMTFDDRADVPVSPGGLPQGPHQPPAEPQDPQDPTPPVNPPQDPSARGELIDAAGGTASFRDRVAAPEEGPSPRGLTFSAIDPSSALGEELGRDGWTGGTLAYAVHDGTSATIGGAEVEPGFWPIMQNRPGPDGSPLTGSATGTALAFGDVLVNAAEIIGTAGSDTFLGGRAGDVLRGGLGNDTMRGGAGNDRLLGGADDDRLFGDAGDDWLAGHKGDDLLDGGAGNDSLLGGFGNDTLIGGAGDDHMSGGADADQFVFVAGETGRDTVYDFQQDEGDTVLLRGAEARDLSFHVTEAGLEMTYGPDATVLFLGVSSQDALQLIFEQV